MSDPQADPFAILIGRELSSIEFVRDYIQLRFDGPCLTIVKDPIVERKNVEYSSASSEFCNVLIGFIGSPVEQTAYNEERVVLQFREGQKIKISLKSDMGEALIFNAENGKWWAW